ncbi:PepSY domain-containing protein [Allochromatium palmeri]|uniref:Peptidase M4 n=1 Tax=Allochromatium palmeri TaxID=231048 RepID=A0A6N8EL84_9GAMM|nr:PepSY domain-containing protein [Allochromatium palmeri]MTW23084.1 peptidase M4 [Allochromatium palmeri]
MNRTLTYTAAITALCLAGLGGAYATDTEQNDALGIADAQISLTQAIRAAEAHVGGQASSAEYEHENGRWVFEVEVVKVREVMDVEVDPSNGQVLSVSIDKADQGDDADREDGSEAND